MTQPFSTVNVLGFDFIKATQQEFVEQLKKDSLSHKNRFVVTANPEIVLTALNDPEYSSVIKGADYLTADGIGIVKGAKILGSSLPGRVTGFDTMTAILKWCDEERKKIYFLGAKNEVIMTMIEKIKTTYTSKTSQESFAKFSLRNPISFSVLWVFRSRNTLLKKTDASPTPSGWESAVLSTF